MGKKISCLLLVCFLFLLSGAAFAASQRNAKKFWELCKKGTVQEVEAAIKAGADVKYKEIEEYSDDTPNSDISYFEESAIIAAASNPDPKVAELLVKRGADVNVEDGYWSPLREAIQNNPNSEVAIYLIRAGADVEGVYTKGFSTALMSAAVKPDIRLTKALIEAGADVDATGRDDMTPLMYAAESNPNVEVTKILIKAGSDINAQNGYSEQTALMYAAESNPNPEVLVALLKAGADVGIKDGSGMTAYDYAKQNKKLKGTEAYKMLEKMTRKR